MEKIRLSRTALPELEFQGEQVIRLAGEDADGSTDGRWHDVAVYRADDGEWVVSIGYRTRQENETPDDFVETARSPKEVEEILSLYDPTERVDRELLQGEGVKLRNTILQTLTRRYDAQVTKTLQAVAQAQPVQR